MDLLFNEYFFGLLFNFIDFFGDIKIGKDIGSGLR